MAPKFVLGFHLGGDVETLHCNLLKQFVGVNQSTASSAVHGAFARLPMYVMRQIRMIKY